MPRLVLLTVALLSLLSCLEGWAAPCYRLTLDGKPESRVVALAERALQRRERMGIGTDSCDLEVSPLYIADLEARGLHVITVSRWLNTVVVMPDDGVEVADSEWASLPFVTSVKQLTVKRQVGAPRRDAGKHDAAIAAAQSTGDCADPLRQVNALEPLYEAGHRGQGMLIAVLDAGFLRADEWDWLSHGVIGHRDLYATVSGRDRTFTADDHGTACLSIMACQQERGVWGTAQDASYYLIRTESDYSETELEEDIWVAGAELADSLGADIISSSLGYTTFDDGLNDHTPDDFCQGTVCISRGAEVACRKGMLVCNAAGNEGNKTWCRLLYPADVADVLTVGGVTATGAPASFTSRGFCTPYVKPDVSARASACFVINANDATGALYNSASGTSYATPLIAGLCASLWSAVPSLTPSQLRECLRQSCSACATPDSITGYGIPDFGMALDLARQLTSDAAITSVTVDAPPAATERDGAVWYTLMGQRCSTRPRHGICVRKGSKDPIIVR